MDTLYKSRPLVFFTDLLRIAVLFSWFPVPTTLIIGSLKLDSIHLVPFTVSNIHVPIDLLHVSISNGVSMSSFTINGLDGLHLQNHAPDVRKQCRPAFPVCQKARNGPHTGTQSTYLQQYSTHARLGMIPQVSKLQKALESQNPETILETVISSVSSHLEMSPSIVMHNLDLRAYLRKLRDNPDSLQYC